MSRTRFDKDKKRTTERAHDAAVDHVYPHLFRKGVDMEFTPTDRRDSKVHEVMDGQLAIDLKIEVEAPLLEQKVPLYVQERFRDPQYRSFQDLTVTKYNNASQRVSEVSKIAAQWIVYGYYEDSLDEVQEAVCVNVPILSRRLISGDVELDEKQNCKRQDFIGIGFGRLDEIGALVCHIDRTKSAEYPVTVDNRQTITAYTTESCGRK
jgi:hypothetical protein